MHHSPVWCILIGRQWAGNSWYWLYLLSPFSKTCVLIFLTERAQAQQAVTASEELFIQPGMYEGARW